MSLNSQIVVLFELMRNTDLSKPAATRRLRSRYAQVTESLGAGDSKLFSQLYRQFLDLKLDRIDAQLKELQHAVRYAKLKEQINTEDLMSSKVKSQHSAKKRKRVRTASGR